MCAKTVYYLITACLISALSSCSIMGPQADPIALLQGKNDAMVTAGLSAPGVSNTILGAAVSATYAPTDHFALQAHAEFPFGSNRYQYPFYTSLNMGYFTNLGSNVIIENFYGGGFGNISTYSDPEIFCFGYGNVVRAYTQINCGRINLGRVHGEFGGGLKLGYVGYYYSFEADLGGNIQYTNRWSHGMLIEPTIFYRFGWEHWKIGLQITGSFSPIFPNGIILGCDPSITLNYCF
ncbi:MAG: hypothetical protein EOL95_11270 [Bacteroidia bacterium]|nr:hypothetical protein [Bacteroidia bacterium]